MTPTPHTIDYTVEYIDEAAPLDPDVAIGNHYFGFFAVDDSILASDGYNKPGQVYAVFTKIEDILWSYNFPYPISQFLGFRGPDAPYSPGFDVFGGEIVNLRGGVYGVFNLPNIDFSSN